MSKEKIHKMKITNINYSSLTRRDLETIETMFGKVEIVKIRQCIGGFSMKIWFKVKGENNDNEI